MPSCVFRIKNWDPAEQTIHCQVNPKWALNADCNTSCDLRSIKWPCHCHDLCCACRPRHLLKSSDIPQTGKVVSAFDTFTSSLSGGYTRGPRFSSDGSMHVPLGEKENLVLNWHNPQTLKSASRKWCVYRKKSKTNKKIIQPFCPVCIQPRKSCRWRPTHWWTILLRCSGPGTGIEGNNKTSSQKSTGHD